VGFPLTRNRSRPLGGSYPVGYSAGYFKGSHIVETLSDQSATTTAAGSGYNCLNTWFIGRDQSMCLSKE
jgi:hypothetical protein